jgi:shikimate dehydrogenase
MRRLAVLGHPVSHSRSPAMQTAALEALGLGGEWSYEAIDLGSEEFESGVRALPEAGFVGANVTIPHKEAALSISTEPSGAAREIGAANTLSFTRDGIRADNTDAPGLIAALPRPAADAHTLVMGAGGSGRAAAWALVREAARVEVWNRTPERADQVVRGLATPVEDGGAEGTLVPVTTKQARARKYELIVNCTAVGMEDDEADPFEQLPLDASELDSTVTVVDLAYRESETRLVAEARQRGAPTVDGLEVLVRQGGESLRIWTGREPPLDAMRAAARGG